MIHKTTRSILSVLLAALLLVASTPLTPAFAGGGAVSLQSESGESEGLTKDDSDTYLIYTADDLKEFADIVNGIADTPADKDANAKLMNDIDLNGSEENPWSPIGNSSQQYSGTFNGDGHTISGLYIDSSDNDYKGLFGYLSTDGNNTGTVKDLTVSGSVKGDDYVGGVVGYNRGRVENCHNIGSVSGDRYVGGVVGDNRGTVENCHNIGEVSGDHVGGVVGYNHGGRVENCYNTGKVSGPDSGNSVKDSSVGGVVGLNRGTVENCYNTGTVSSNSNISDVGGVVGFNGGTVEGYNGGTVEGYNGGTVEGYNGGTVEGWNRGTVENCYNTGTVTGTGDYVGGVVGYNSSIGNVKNCYNTGKVIGSSVGGVVGDNHSSGNVTGCYFLQSTAASGIGGGNDSADATPVDDLSELCNAFNDTNTWTISENLSRPVLKDNHEDDGTQAHPYRISTATQLENFRDIVNGASGQVKDSDAHAKLMNNINLSSVCGPALDAETSWTPIGTFINSYEGTFDGNGKTIENLYINNIRSDYQGLFGRVNGGTVKDLTVSGSVSGNNYVGGVVGYNNVGTVTGCIFSGSGSVTGVTGSSDYVGGVVGYNDGGSVTNSYNTGSVSGRYVGGVVGSNSFSATVTNCYNTGKVSGNSYVGGVVGYNVIRASVENCYNTGTVSGSSYVGGVVGYNETRASVENCCNTATVSGGDTTSPTNVGGVVGYNYNSTVENCYNTGEVSGNTSGGVVGLNDSGSVTNCYNTGNVSGSISGGVVGNNYSGTVENCYNTGTVSDGTASGGVVGQNSGSVTNCYYQQQAGLDGIGSGGKDTDSATEKDNAAFHSGEVAHLLQGTQATPVWGQNLTDSATKDEYPQLRAFNVDTPQVYKVAFISDSEEYDAKYANNGMTVDLPATEPTKEGYTFNGWFTEASGGSQWNFSTAVTKNMTLYAQWTAVEEPTPTPTPTPDPTPSGPSTGDSTGWDDILDELENTAKGDEITIDMGDETKVPAEIFESLAGKDVEISFDLGDIQWSVNGADIPTDTDFTDLDLGASLGTSGIPVNVINTITGEVGTVQITLAHNGEFGFTMTLTAPLGKENAGYWANLYHYDEDAEALNFEAVAKIDEDGSVTIPFSHASQYAIVIDTHSHATVDVSDIFVDVAPNAWYKDAVQYAYDHGLMTGVSATEFAPEQTTTRAMIVSILARLEGVTTAEAAGFADVDDNDWYATAVNWAANVGVVNGYEDNTFRPNTAITREQLAAILMNYASYKGEDVSNRADLTSYTDQPSTWAQEAMQWAVAEGLISGVTNTELQPQGNATRAQVAAILQRFLSE